MQIILENWWSNQLNFFEIFKLADEPLILISKLYFWIRTIIICVYHINLPYNAENVQKCKSIHPSTTSYYDSTQLKAKILRV